MYRQLCGWCEWLGDLVAYIVPVYSFTSDRTMTAVHGLAFCLSCLGGHINTNAALVACRTSGDQSILLLYQT